MSTETHMAQEYSHLDVFSSAKSMHWEHANAFIAPIRPIGRHEGNLQGSAQVSYLISISANNAPDMVE